jgi:glycosyltransferase involved in cell wall biosynthesis
VAQRWHTRYVLEPRPGAARARNRGARAAHGEIVVFTDDDAAPEPGWLKALLPEFRDPEVALVAGRVVAPVAQPKLEALYELCGFLGQGHARIVVDRDSPGWFEQVNFLPFGLALNLAVRRAVFHGWPGFDERIGVGTAIPGHEEQRAFLQLIDLGYRLVYVPEALVAHPLSPKCAEELCSRSLRRMQASGAYLTLLMVEEPAHRREVLAHVMRWLKHKPSAERAEAGTRPAMLRQIVARLQGPALYFRSCLRNRP